MTIPPPALVPGVGPTAWLFENVEVPIDADPEPMPPGEENAKINKSAPPPPIPAAVLWIKVDPETVNVPIPPMCFGDEGVYAMPPPLPACVFPVFVLLRSV